jgi:hypothetical protein
VKQQTLQIVGDLLLLSNLILSCHLLIGLELLQTGIRIPLEVPIAIKSHEGEK